MELVKDTYAEQYKKFTNLYNELVDNCNTKAPNLFFADEFQPKEIPPGSCAEVVFWFQVVNMYGLFHDAAKYFHPEALLSNIDPDKNGQLRDFWDALNELRSCFCHNKPSDSFIREIMNVRTLNNLVAGWTNNEWGCFIHLRSSKAKFSYADSLELLMQASINIIIILNDYVKSRTDDKFIKEWSDAIVDWYLKSPSAKMRASQRYYILNKQMLDKKLITKKKIIVKLNNNMPKTDTLKQILYDTYFSKNASNPQKITPLIVFKDYFDYLCQ